HRHPPSFPTRRSSDLSLQVPSITRLSSATAPGSETSPRSTVLSRYLLSSRLRLRKSEYSTMPPLASTNSPNRSISKRPCSTGGRSEEHTSELQSLAYL